MRFLSHSCEDWELRNEDTTAHKVAFKATLVLQLHCEVLVLINILLLDLYKYHCNNNTLWFYKGLCTALFLGQSQLTSESYIVSLRHKLWTLQKVTFRQDHDSCFLLSSLWAKPSPSSYSLKLPVGQDTIFMQHWACSFAVLEQQYSKKLFLSAQRWCFADKHKVNVEMFYFYFDTFHEHQECRERNVLIRSCQCVMWTTNATQVWDN